MNLFSFYVKLISINASLYTNTNQTLRLKRLFGELYRLHFFKIGKFQAAIKSKPVTYEIREAFFILLNKRLYRREVFISYVMIIYNAKTYSFTKLILDILSPDF
jgi:hypothetical protein